MAFEWKEEETLALLKQLAETPSPTGYTMAVTGLIQGWLEKWGIPYTVTKKGSIIATVEGQDDSRHRLLTAHVDTLGAMVREVKPNGRLKLSLVGGFHFNSIEGENCIVHTAGGTQISGTVLMHQTTVHVYKDAASAERNADNMEVRLDAKTATADETRSLGIEVGDFVSFAPRYEQTEEGFIKSRHLDDKASAALLLQLMHELSDGPEIPYTTHFYISNNEEIGYGGNSNIPGQTEEYIAVDMGAIGDGQMSDEFTVSICAKDSSGPYHYGLTRHLIELAQREGIGYKVDLYPYYSSDASAAVRSGQDVRHALFGPGIEASHAYERTHTDSLKHTYALIGAYVMSPLS